MKPVPWLRLAFATMLAVGMLCPPQALAQVPARFYWKTLSNANAVPLIVESISGNTNPFDPAHTVTPGAHFEATLALPGYARTFSLFETLEDNLPPRVPVDPGYPPLLYKRQFVPPKEMMADPKP